MRCRIEWVSVSAPSAVCTTLTPSCALRTATFRPPTCERRPSEMAKPAASSAARLMRKPLESFSRDLPIWLSETYRVRYEFIAAMFWLMRRPMMILLRDRVRVPPFRGRHPSHRQPGRPPEGLGLRRPGDVGEGPAHGGWRSGCRSGRRAGRGERRDLREVGGTTAGGHAL